MKHERQNILLITTDQQRFDTIAAHGNQEIYTPHLDWLSDEGIHFSNAYSGSPICMAARATIMTGKNAYALGLTANGDMARAMDGRQTLPGILTQAGYQTRAQGKMHFSPMFCHYGFEQMELPWAYYKERNQQAGGGRPKQHGVGENEMTPVISTVSETDSLTHWTVKRSIDFLESRDPTRPFFMWTSFTKPHPPFDPCANYWMLYQNREVSPPVRGSWSDNIESMPQGFLSSTYSLNNAYRMSDRKLQDVKRAYYACITHVDYELGLLFARMREMNLLENTWIIFTSDHGEMLGDHRMGAKKVFLEGSAHIPLIIRPPSSCRDDKPRAGEKVELMAQLADIMPTILTMAGLDVPEDADGTDLLTLDQNRAVISLCEDQGGVLLAGVKYCYAQKGSEELLFDLTIDPMETMNRIDDPAYQDRLSDLRCRFVDMLSRHNPEWVNDGKLVGAPAIKGPNDVNKWPGYHSTDIPSDVLH